MATAAAGKLQGFLSKMSFLAPGTSGTQVQLKSIQSWEVDVQAKEIEASDHDTQGWEDALPGMGRWTATVKGLYFEGDASQKAVFEALVAGLSGNGNIACSFYPQVGTAGDGTLVYTGTGFVTNWKHSADQTNAQLIDVSIRGRGALLAGDQ